MTDTNPDPRIEVLRATMLEVEQTAGISPDDPALMALKRIILQRMADIELSKVTESASPEPGPARLSSTDNIEALPPSPAESESDE